jgi:hypothetical protein
VDREDLTVGQVDAETKADQREDVAGEERVLPLRAQGGQDQDVVISPRSATGRPVRYA